MQEKSLRRVDLKELARKNTNDWFIHNFMYKNGAVRLYLKGIELHLVTYEDFPLEWLKGYPQILTLTARLKFDGDIELLPKKRADTVSFADITNDFAYNKNIHWSSGKSQDLFKRGIFRLSWWKSEAFQRMVFRGHGNDRSFSVPIVCPFLLYFTARESYS